MNNPSVNSIVENLTRIADASRRDDGSDIPLGEQCREAATIISELQAEREKLRRYCSAAAYDYGNLLTTLEASIGAPFIDAFQETRAELRDSSEFMKLASEGRESGLLYDDELSKAKSSLSRIKGETIEACAKVAGGTFVGAPDDNEYMVAGKEIATAIRSLSSTGGDVSEKTAESGHSPSTLNAETK